MFAACTTKTISAETVFSWSKTAYEKRWETFFEKKSSERPESVWEKMSNTVQRLHQWKVHEPIVSFLAPYRMSQLQNGLGMQIRWKVRFYAQRGWQSAQQTTEKYWW